jgi:hypothetical protein
MKLHLIAAATLAASSLAHAGLDNFDTGNSSLAFIAYDNIGASRSSAFIDLGIGITDFAPTGDLAADNTSIVWNFATNTIVKNGVSVTGTNDFSAFGQLLLSAQASEFRWGVIGGESVSEDVRVWTTGTPTARNLTAQDAGFTFEMKAVGTELYSLLAPKLGSADNGSFYAAESSTSGFVADPGIAFGENWRTNLKWASTTAGNQTNFWMNVGDGSEVAVGTPQDPLADLTGLLNGKGTFTLDRANQTLVWQTAAVVPEPGTYALALGGLAVMGLVARRRRAQ